MNNLQLLEVKLLLLAWQWTWTFQEANQSKMLQVSMSVVTSDVGSFCH